MMTELSSIEGVASAADADLDQDAAFFELSSAGAEQVTLQIRSMLERAWEYIAIAYQGRAHLALGYERWDDYVDDRLGDLRLTVPREQRGAAVQSLSRAQMSLRAIAKVLGVSVATAHRDASVGEYRGGGEFDELHGGEPASAIVQGRDGRQYPRRRKTACTDLRRSARGATRPMPLGSVRPGTGTATRRDSAAIWSGNLHSRSVRRSGSANTPERGGRDDIAGNDADSVTRAVCIVDELAGLPELVDEIEVAGVAGRSRRAGARRS